MAPPRALLMALPLTLALGCGGNPNPSSCVIGENVGLTPSNDAEDDDESTIRSIRQPVSRCFPRSLIPDTVPVDGGSEERVNCKVFEVSRAAQHGGTCNCAAAGLAEATRGQRAWLTEQTQDNGLCEGEICCSHFCACELPQYTGEYLDDCRTTGFTSPPGWCYVDADQELGDPRLVEDCPLSEKRQLLLKKVHSSSTVFVGCEVDP